MVELSVKIASSFDDCTRRIVTASETERFMLNRGALITGYQSSSERMMGSAMRFQNITIPYKSTIDSAYVKMYSASNQYNSGCKTLFSAENVGNPDNFEDDDKDTFDARYANNTTATVAWDNISGWTLNQAVSSPDIKTVIQEIVNRADWAAGNSIVIFWEDFAGRSSASSWATRYTFAYDNGAYLPYLLINYTPATTGGAFTFPKKIRSEESLSFLPSE